MNVSEANILVYQLGNLVHREVVGILVGMGISPDMGTESRLYAMAFCLMMGDQEESYPAGRIIRILGVKE